MTASRPSPGWSLIRVVGETPERDGLDGAPVSEVDPPTETDVGWLSPETLELVRANVPMVYVDAVPVRVDGRAASPRSACCCGWPPTARSAGWS